MKRFSLNAVLIIAVVLAFGASAPVLAQGTGGEDITLVPFTSSDYTLSGVMPQGWLAMSSGAYARRASQADVVVLVQQAVPGATADQIATALLNQIGLTALPDRVETRETAAFAWDLYVIEVEASVGTVRVDLALAETDETAYFVLMQVLADEYEALHDAVFLPAVDALALVTLSWGPAEADAADPADVEAVTLVPEVLDERPHDPAAYTQGFLLHDGSLYESTGQRGFSTLREVDPATGEVLRSIDIDEQYFAEGLALVDDRLVQLTWQEDTAFVYDLETFEQLDTYTYEGEGWGLCYDGEVLYMSDGSPTIAIRDPQTFELLYRGMVTLEGEPINRLNELECVGDTLYANVWQTNFILQIDTANGAVLAVIDASGLFPDEVYEAFGPQEVLNGIAYDPETDTFLITGKHWPSMFEVRFVEPGVEGEADR